jgi:hypothetical protein
MVTQSNLLVSKLENDRTNLLDLPDDPLLLLELLLQLDSLRLLEFASFDDF